MSESDTSRHFLRQWIEKDVADGKTGGKVVTRFPPEPNGYIHIGHAKAVCVDFGMAELFGGECHLRLDDTNPTKESDEYAENIKKDIRWLGFQWSGEGDAGEPGFYNASNMFDKMYAIAEELIRRGQAYCCNLTQDEWKEYRGVPEKPGTPSPSRDTSPERNLQIFHEMRDGKYADGEWCLRAKIDMASPNIHFRDPVIYRIRHVTTISATSGASIRCTISPTRSRTRSRASRTRCARSSSRCTARSTTGSSIAWTSRGFCLSGMASRFVRSSASSCVSTSPTP